ncbi:MAG: HAMP domain-containing histidine kinase [Clostridia bacterium]|nr:HAMP domain-containing histidine kinase [Clostridia bacterium]
MNIYADLLVEDIEEEQEVKEEHVKPLTDSGVIVIHFRESDDLRVIYPRLENADYDFLRSIVSTLNVADKEAVSNEVTLSSGMNIFYTARRIDLGAADDYIVLYTSMSSVEDAVAVLRKQLFTVAVIVILCSLFISYIIAERISRPIDDMSAMADKWSKGDETIRFKGGSYTEIDELANALNKAKTEVNKTNKLQRDLMANVSHDLKTPLTMIKAYAEMIKDISGNNKEKRDKHTQVIIDESDRLTLLVNDILNLSKLQSDADRFELKKVNLSVLVEAVLYRFDAVVNERGYKLEREIDKDVYVFVDEKKIEEVIYNLVGNAINYAGEGKTVKVFLKLNGDNASLEVIDDGKGIDSEKIQTIWDRYLRYSETHQRAVKGTGLGLSIVKAILDHHNLEYGVISKEGLGSNFYVVFKVLPESVGGEGDE